MFNDLIDSKNSNTLIILVIFLSSLKEASCTS